MLRALYPSAESCAGMTLAKHGVDRIAQLLFERILGEMIDFTSGPARLAGFCHCQETTRQLAKLPHLGMLTLPGDSGKVDLARCRTQVRHFWGKLVGEKWYQ